MNKDYRLVYRGERLPGFSDAEVQANIANLFQVSAERAAALLAQVPCVVKQHLDVIDGNRYLEALAWAGIVTHLENGDGSGWDGVERRHGDRRLRLRDRRGQHRDTGIRPERREREERRKTH